MRAHTHHLSPERAAADAVLWYGPRRPVTDPEEMLRYFEVPRRPGVFTLGWRSRRITVLDQQVRALNLIDALAKTGRLRKDAYVSVVGAGFGGLMVAAAAATLGARVRVVHDRPGPLDLQRGCDHRWLHPHVNDWPAAGSANPNANVLLLDWRAAKASQVVDSVERKWRRLVVRHAIQESPSTVVKNVHASGEGWVLDTEPVSPEIRSETCTAVTLAVGFGLEKQVGARRLRSYWHRDNLHRFPLEVPGSTTIRYLIAGSGDGALIDTLRAKLSDFRHDTVLEDFGLLSEAMRSTVDRILAIESEAQRRGDAGDFLRVEYCRLRGTEVVDDVLRKRAHRNVEVVLSTRAPHFHSLRSSALNRFLVSRLVSLDLVRHQQGELASVEGDAPARARLVGSDREEDFFDVVTRVGPESGFALHLRTMEDELRSTSSGPPDPDPTRVPQDWSSLRSRPLPPPAPTTSPPERPLVVFYPTSERVAIQIVNSRGRGLEIGAVDQVPLWIDDTEAMAYRFFCNPEEAWHHADDTYGAEASSVVEVRLERPPLLVETAPGGIPQILITDLSYVTSRRLVQRGEGVGS